MGTLALSNGTTTDLNRTILDTGLARWVEKERFKHRSIPFIATSSSDNVDTGISGIVAVAVQDPSADCTASFSGSTVTVASAAGVTGQLHVWSRT